MRRAIIGVLGIAVAVAACVVYVQSIEFDRFRPQLVEELRQATGRDVAIEGALELSLFPTPRFMLSGVSIANAPWGTRPTFAGIERVEADIALLPLLGGELRIRRVRLVRPDLWFETDPYGKVNWVLAGGPISIMEETARPREGSGSLLAALAVRRLDLTGGRLSYRDGATGDIAVVSIGSASMESDGGRNSSLKLTFAGDWNALPIRLRGAMGPRNAVASRLGNATEIGVVVQVAGMGLFVEGTVGDPRTGPGANVHIAGRAGSLDGLAAILGVAVPRTGKVSLDADLSYRQARLELSAIKLAIGEQSAAGTMSIDLSGARPAITAKLAATRVDLTHIAVGPADAEPGASSTGLGLVEALLGSGLLAAVDGTADIRADTVQAGPLALNDAAAHVVLENGDVVVDPLRARAAAGALEGSFRLAGKADPPRLTLSLKAPVLAIGPALQRLETIKAFGGVASVAANLSTVAGPLRQMLSALQGEALIAMGEGHLVLEPFTPPFDAAAAGLGGLVGLVAQEGREELAVECLAGRMTVEDGVATTDRFVVLTEDARLKGQGTIDLTTGRLALRFIAEALGGKLIVAAPVSVGGSFAKPVLSLEAAAANAPEFSDTALYPIRQLFAELAAEPVANACLRGLPPAPRKRRPATGRSAGDQQPDKVQEAAAPRQPSAGEPRAASPAE